MNEPITVIKRNETGAETWRYEGFVLHREPGLVRLQALFNRDDLPFQDIVLRHHDRFVETFFLDRWYNIFEIHDREDDRVKGWYCNFAFPAVLEGENAISYCDLSLDLWVSASGKRTFLDWDEYARLRLNAFTRRKVREAAYELLALSDSFFAV
jgi:hypothetical protein